MTPEPNSWQWAWQALAAQQTDAELTSLAEALERNDSRLLQGATCEPAPMEWYFGDEVERACGVCWGLWQVRKCYRVGELDNAFRATLFAADQLLAEPAATRFFVNWFDETPRSIVFPALALEVRAELARRAEGVTANE